MDRGAPAEKLAWLMIPAAATLVAAALSLSLQPYAGVILRGAEVIAVLPGGPGEESGIAAGDRLAGASAAMDALRGPLAGARPGQPLALERERAGKRTPVRLVPVPLPAGERRMMVALLMLAAGFVLLGGWVWSERRDRLTLPFHLLCLAFAVLLAPQPRLSWPPAVAAHEVFYTLATLLLPALCVHFFALFPDPRSSSQRLVALVRACYGVAGLLAIAWLLALGGAVLGTPIPAPLLDALQAAAAIWFAAGLLMAVALFAASYRRADSDDARRRLRVTLAGTAIGLGPLAAMIVVRNLFPGVAIPGERVALFLVLLVPLSFAWATAVHRIFDFRVALRGAVIASLLALCGAALYFAGDLMTALRPQAGIDFGGVALAAVSLAAALAGPVRPGLRAVGGTLMPLRDERPLTEVLAAGLTGRDHSVAGLLGRACETLVAALRLDRCYAIEITAGGPRPTAGIPALPASLRLGPTLAASLAGSAVPLAIDDPAFAPGDREALEVAGIQWVLPIGNESPLAALLLGRRLAGPWLDRREMESLARCAQHLEVALENVSLRDAARSHGVLDRELEEAGAIQARLLPRRAPVFPTLDCAAATLSSEAVGGDYYDFVEREGRAFTLVVGDAAGHGVPAALLLAGVQARFRSEAVRDREPGPLLTALNLEMARHDYPEKFVGLLCARVDVPRARVHFANAGLMPPFVRRRTGDWEETTTGGLLLGVRSDSHYPDCQVDLGAGDVLVIYTDGLTEAQRGEELFGPERVRKVLDRHAHRRAADILAALVDAVRAFADGPLDDLTVVVLKQLADPTAEAAGVRSRAFSSRTMGVPILPGETTDAVSPARAANPRAADPNG